MRYRKEFLQNENYEIIRELLLQQKYPPIPSYIQVIDIIECDSENFF